MPANIKITPAPHGKIDIDVTCEKCGEPIITTDEYGMYCKNRCGEKENKEAAKRLPKILKRIFDNIILNNASPKTLEHVKKMSKFNQE